MDNIKGTLYVKDLLSHIDRGDEFGWQQLIRRPYFVPEHKKINDLLADFQNQKIHMAIVVDEYGSTQGLVSLEDIVEEVPTCSTARPISAISNALWRLPKVLSPMSRGVPKHWPV